MFFRKFYANSLYEKWKAADYKSLDYVLRFENLQEDFSKIIKGFGIKQKRPLPVINKTLSKKAEFTHFYPKDIQGRVRIVFGRYMKRWSYKFPSEWKKPSMWESVFARSYLNIKYILQRLFHLIVDSPYLYGKIYGRRGHRCERSSFSETVRSS